MLAQHLGHDHLREKNLVDLVQQLPRHFEFELLGFVEFDSDHQAFAARSLDKGMFPAQRIDLLYEERPHSSRVLD